MAAAASVDPAPHIPVLLRPLIEAVSPVEGVWLDGTFGAGGYARAFLEAGADKLIGLDRDPSVFAMASEWSATYGARLELHEAVFSGLDAFGPLDGVVLDLGVSSMQLDQADRGFSFMRDGPLDMRMGRDGPSAADLVNTAPEGELADLLFLYGEERASRRIARAIVAARPLTTTLALAEVIEGCLPRSKPGQAHPATRSFQAIRIAVNAEYDELYQGLMAAERALKPGGQLAVVTFHSIEDRMVKRFMAARSGQTGRANRYAPEAPEEAPAFRLVTRKAVGPDEQELAENPRARSARLRVARRTDAPACGIEAKALGMPQRKDKRS